MLKYYRLVTPLDADLLSLIQKQFDELRQALALPSLPIGPLITANAPTPPSYIQTYETIRSATVAQIGAFNLNQFTEPALRNILTRPTPACNPGFVDDHLLFVVVPKVQQIAAYYMLYQIRWAHQLLTLEANGWKCPLTGAPLDLGTQGRANSLEMDHLIPSPYVPDALSPVVFVSRRANQLHAHLPWPMWHPTYQGMLNNRQLLDGLISDTKDLETIHRNAVAIP